MDASRLMANLPDAAVEANVREKRLAEDMHAAGADPTQVMPTGESRPAGQPPPPPPGQGCRPRQLHSARI